MQAEVPIDSFGDDYMAPISIPNLPSSSGRHAAPPEKLSKKRITALMEERTEEALAVPIASSNIGFQLLRKLGYSGDEGLGKEPIAIVKRQPRDMSGLGIVDTKAVQKEEQAGRKKQRLADQQVLQSAFQQGAAASYSQTKLRKDIHGVQKAIYQLDVAQAVPVHRLSRAMHQLHALPLPRTADDIAYDPDHANSSEDEHEEEVVMDEAFLLECLEYLRGRHRYCFYCGTAFEDEQDMQAHCPGLTDDDH